LEKGRSVSWHAERQENEGSVNTQFDYETEQI